jgi:hypothetical protein
VRVPLGGHQAEHHGLAGGEKTQRLEPARGLVVIFEEGLDGELVVYSISDRLLAAGRHPTHPGVAAPEMNAGQHVRRRVADHVVFLIANILKHPSFSFYRNSRSRVYIEVGKRSGSIFWFLGSFFLDLKSLYNNKMTNFRIFKFFFIGIKRKICHTSFVV